MSEYKFTKVEQAIKTKSVLPDGTVSISSTGRVGLSRDFIDEYGISADSRAQLYWDSSRNAIAISFVAGKRKLPADTFNKIQPEDGYNVALVGGGRAGGYIAANGFFKQIGVDPTEHEGYYKYKALDAAEAGITDGGKMAFLVTLTVE